MSGARRAKIIATLGPASSSEEQVETLVRAGVDVFRLNFSHGTQEQHGQRIVLIRTVAERVGKPVAILQDLQGPKIRTGRLEGGGPVQLHNGGELTITTRERIGNERIVSTTYQELPGDVKPGDRVLLDDGRIRLSVVECTATEVRARVENGGPLGEHKGINLPGVAVSAPALTDKDRADLRFGLEQGVDFVALSFIRSGREVREARQLVESLGYRVPLIVKLEKPQAIDDLDDILTASDGVMVARGDLGVELPLERVPSIQKLVIRKANRVSKLVITATQMLESMIEEPTPTRAEATDVANAVWDGTDVLMLSGETAVGRFPVQAVEMMDRIIREAERQAPRMEPHTGRLTHAHAISHAACAMVEDLDVETIVCFTRTGRTARLLSQDRPRVPIIALTPEPAVQRRLAIWWGVTPIVCRLPESTDTLIQTMERTVLERGFIRRGEHVLVVGTVPFKAGVHTNFLKVHHVD